MGPVLFFLVLALLVALGVWQYRVEQRRREAFRAWCAAHDWSWFPGKDKRHARRYRFVNRLNQGYNHWLRHRVVGTWRGRPAEAFTFHYQTGSGKNTQHWFFGVVVLALERSFPELTIQPENFFDKLAAAFGFDDIDFESAEFSRRFAVRSRDKKFAYDVCHPRAMEFLLAHRGPALEVEGDRLVGIWRGRQEAADLAPRLDFLSDFRELWPGYLFREDPFPAGRTAPAG